MEKILTFDYNGDTYTLEFTRKSIQQMEKNGFITSELADKPMSSLPVFFMGHLLLIINF